MDKHAVVPIEQRLIHWRELDRAALAAEADVQELGQSAADPRARDLYLNAKTLREQADREFAAILRGVTLEQPGDSRSESANEVLTTRLSVPRRAD